MRTCLDVLSKKQAQEARELGEEAPYPPEPLGGEADPEAAALSAERRAEHGAALILRY